MRQKNFQGARSDQEHQMNKLLAVAVGVMTVGLSVPASAADLAARPYTKAPMAPAAAIYDWSGFYVGINGGGGSAHNCWDLLIPALTIPQGCHDSTGGTVGRQIGYRWQSGNWVFGLEGQGNWADFSGNSISRAFPAERDRSRIGAFGLVTGQIGYAWNNVLLYVKGGGAVVGDRYDIYSAATGAL